MFTLNKDCFATWNLNFWQNNWEVNKPVLQQSSILNISSTLKIVKVNGSSQHAEFS